MEENHDCYDDFSNIMTGYRDLSTILDDVPEEPEGTNMTSDAGIHIQKTIDDMADTNLSSPVISSMNSRSRTRKFDPPSIQPNHSGYYPGFGPPPYANTSVQHESGSEFGRTQSGLNAFPSAHYICYPGGTSRYAQDEFPTTSMPPPYANFCHTTYPTGSSIRPQGPTFMHAQPDFTSEMNLLPPGTMPPDRRHG